MKRLLLLTFVACVFISKGIAQDSVSSFSATINFAIGEVYSYSHKLGVNPGNTIGLDTNSKLGAFNETPFMVPPPPPSYSGRSRFLTIPGRPTFFPQGLFSGVLVDYRGFTSKTQIDSYRVQIDGDSVLTNASSVFWSITELAKYADAWTIKPLSGTAFAQTDMLQNGFVIIPEGAASRDILIIKTGAKYTKVLTSVDDQQIESPREFSLSQNFPNPFNPETKIQYALPSTERVSLKVFDILGKEVATLVNQVQQQGHYTVRFNGTALSSGMYFYRIQTGSYISVKRMILIK
ncbi:MAG TPA: hypothetical protein DCQ28_03095 [Bacteroidetes bacterium]|nr:hypothetical protein [Bacteroidota bacterium]